MPILRKDELNLWELPAKLLIDYPVSSCRQPLAVIVIDIGMATDTEAAKIALTIVNLVAVDVVGVQIHSIEFVFYV